MAETSKKRTVRIPLDYYKKPDGLSWWRWVLSFVAVLVATGWAAGLNWDFWSASRREARMRQLASHGPLARSHASWDAQCDACHVPFRPIGQASWATPLFGDSRQSNTKCQSCHAAGIHHARQDPQELACARCHHDHQGRDASLVRIADQHCRQCHTDLTAHIQGDGPPAVDDTVTRFDGSPDHHPEFRSTGGIDPGHLAFDHARHLTLGMGGSQSGPIQTLGMIPEPDRGHYKQYAQGKDALIKLDCAACHQLAREDTRSASPSPPPHGGPAYMLPVTYQNHCRACHPLDFDPSFPTLVIPHPSQPEDVDATLWKTYAAEFLKQNAPLLEERVPPRPMPGRMESPPAGDARQAIGRMVGAAEKILFGAKKCGECHSYENSAHEPVAALDRWDPANPVRVTPTNIPVVWWRSATFTHSAHRAVDCRVCHERAYPESKGASHQSKDVLLPAVKDCLQCHAPRGRASGANAVTGGAGSDCTECHRYHNGDAALLDLSATPSSPATRLSLEQFLLGTPGPRPR
jgi:hypothetical protein